jgi:hypothetical protein
MLRACNFREISQTLLGLVKQLPTGLVAKLRIWLEGAPCSKFFDELRQTIFE